MQESFVVLFITSDILFPLLLLLLLMCIECTNKMEVFGSSVQMRISRNFMFQVWKPCIKCKTQVAMLWTPLSCMFLPVRYKELWGAELLLSSQKCGGWWQ